MGNCLTVSHTCLLHLPRSWVYFFVPGTAKRSNLTFYLSVSGFNQVEWGREMNPRFSFATLWVWELPHRPTASDNLVCMCVIFVDDEANGGWVLFYWGLMLLWEMSVGFENTCTASGKWDVFRVISRLYGWVYKTWRLFPLADEHSVAVMTTGPQTRRSQIVSNG